MDISVKRGNVQQQKTPCLTLFINTSKPGTAFNTLDQACNGTLKQLIDRGDLGKKPGKTLLIPVSLIEGIDRILLVSLGDNPFTLERTNKAIDGAVSKLQQANIRETTICMEGLKATENLALSCQYLTQQLLASSYRFTHFKQPTEDQQPNLNAVSFLYNGDQNLESAINNGLATGHGVNVAKNLGNLPGNICTPSYLAAQAEALASKNDCISTHIIDEQAMKELGMNSFLSVSKGSDEEGKLIVMEYKGGKKDDAPYVLLGKGITFDSGGISLKPGASMDEMKYDMCGAASVMGVMAAITELKPAINVTGVIASAENMPAGNASKPGDIVTSMSGKTIEILNTDAEGRLVLCDALTYIERFDPEVVIDIATLTGACITALGHHISALISNNDALAENLTSIGNAVSDPAWRMPMGELYDDQLKSNFADLANIGGAAGGTITAGCFLAKFADSYPWAHLDIAGTSWKSGKEKGATGRPVPLLLNYLLSKSVA